MLMRSHSPIHGVGRFACRRGASKNVNPPNTRSTTIGDRVHAEALHECRGANSDREKHEEDRYAAQNDVHGVAQRASAGGQHLALMHRRKRSQEPERCVGQDETARDSYGAISTGGFPEAKSEGGHQHGVDPAEPRP